MNHECIYRPTRELDAIYMRARVVVWFGPVHTGVCLVRIGRLRISLVMWHHFNIERKMRLTNIGESSQKYY